MAPPVFQRADVWSDLSCFSGVRTCFLDDILGLTTTRTVDNRDELTLTIGRTNRALPFLVKLAVIRLVFSDTTYDEEWRITGITQDQVKGTYVVTCDWPLIDLATRATLCSTPALVTDDQAPYAFEAIGLTPAQHFDNYVMRGFPAAWSGKVGRGTFDVATPQDLVYDWDKPRKIIGDLAQLTNTEISYRRNGSTSYLVDLLTAIGASAPVLDVRLGKNIAGITVKEDENQRATTVYPRSALVDGVSYGLAQNRWKIAAMNAGAKTIDLLDPAGKAGPIAFDHQFGTTGLAWRLFKANGPPVSASNRIITDSAVANQRITVSVDPTLIFAVNDLVCFGDIDGSSNYVPVWSLNDGPQAIVDPPVAVLKRDDVVAGINLVPNPVMRTWSGGAGTAPDSWVKVDASTTLTKRTTAADWQSGGQSCRVQTTGNYRGIETGLTAVTPTTGAPSFTAFARFRIDALTGGAGVRVILYAESLSGPVIVRIYPGTWTSSQSAAQSTQIGQWITIAISVPLLLGEGSCTLTAERLKLQIVQDGAGTADFTVDSAQITQTSYQLPLIEGASGNVLWQAANELITAQRGAQKEYAVELLDLASSDPTAFPYDQIQLGQTLRVTDPDVGASAVSLRLLSLARDHITDGALTPAKVRVQVGVLAPSGAGLLAGSTLNGRQGPVSAVSGSGSRIGNAPVIPPDFTTPVGPLVVYAHDFPGSDWGEQVQAAHDSLGSDPAIIDCTGLFGVQTAAAEVAISKDNITLLLGTMTLTCALDWIFVTGDNCTIEGAGRTRSQVTCSTAWDGTNLFGVEVQDANGFTLRRCGITLHRTGAAVFTATNGMAVYIHGTCQNWLVEDNDIEASGTEPDSQMRYLGIFAWSATATFPILCGNGVIQRNRVHDTDGRCIEVALCEHVAITGNVIRTGGSAATIVCVGIRVIGSEQIAITGNVIDITGGASLGNADCVQVNGDNVSTNISISGNAGRTNANGGTAVKIGGNASHVTLSGNVWLYDGASTALYGVLVTSNPGIATGDIPPVHIKVTGDYIGGFGAQLGIDRATAGDTYPSFVTFTENTLGARWDGAALLGNFINTNSADRLVNNILVHGNHLESTSLTTMQERFQGVLDAPGIQFGALSALTGEVRFPRTGVAKWRNQAGTLDINAISVTSSDNVQIGGTNSVETQLTPGGTAVARARSTALSPGSTGGFSLGESSLRWLDLLLSGVINMSAAASRLIAGATSFSVRNNANSADNLLVSDAGAVTVRAGLTLTANDLTFGAAASRLIPGATSLALRDTANAADNLLMTDAGLATFRNFVTGKRWIGNGTAHVAGDYALSAGWGTTATVSAVAAKDTGGRVTIASTGTGQAANPTITLTWKDGTWTTVPAVVVSRGDTAAAAGDFRNATPGATTVVITFVGTPVAGQTYILDFVANGK